jgi:hypothetical protein
MRLYNYWYGIRKFQRKRQVMTQMPHSRTWQQVLSSLYDERTARMLVARAAVLHTCYWLEDANGVQRSDRQTLRTRVLPGLAIYMALLEINEDRDKVLSQMEELFKAAFFTTQLRGIRLLNSFPDPFPIVRPVLRSMPRTAYLPGSQEIMEDTRDCFAISVYRCFILDVLTRHQAAELTPLFCLTDDWLSEAMPKIGWERTNTLGRGGDCCDFRWYRKK